MKFDVSHYDELKGKIVDPDKPDKYKFLLDMLCLTKTENFDLARGLEEQAEMLKSFASIARKVGEIKQDAEGKLVNLAKGNDIKIDINLHPFRTIVLHKDSLN